MSESTTPSFAEIQRLISSKKPPLAARIVERRDGTETRAASVVFDGINAWFIDDGSKIELRAAEDRVVFVEEGSVERVGPGMVASSNNWVKSAIDGRRLAYLERADGEVLGPDELFERSCWLVRANGLRADEDAVFLLHVDTETGVILREAREDLDLVLDVEELMLGSVTERDREAESGP
jgi:hypothetical protein